jgi:molybdate transport system ATP-binding protein
MKQNTIVEIVEAVPRFEYVRFDKPVNWSIREGQHWAIIGPNGAGKTLLIDILLRKYALLSGEVVCRDEEGKDLSVSGVVKSVAFRDIYSLVDTQSSYYQQRWNKGIEQEVPYVRDLVAKADTARLDNLVEWFGIEDLMDKELNLLSSGELRKFLIVKSLLSKPKVLILDNPFIGLDKESRTVLNNLFKRLAELDNLQIVLVLSNPDDIPEIITDVLPVKNKHLYDSCSREEFLADNSFITCLFEAKNLNIQEIQLLKEKYRNNSSDFTLAALLKNIHVKYDNRTILKDLNWQVRRGEKWALLGPNGSGKSTLLSLICGDNPQAYANDITLFDKKRGTGESIWDIKKRIGYISPEMHLYYLKNVRCIDVVGSGFFDTIGLYRKCTEEQEVIALEWMKILNIDKIKDISFLNVSSGEQRLVLLARVFVKNPDLLILDEPLHGLDVLNKRRAKAVIESFCDSDKSLIYVTHYEHEIPNVVNERLILSKN